MLRRRPTLQMQTWQVKHLSLWSLLLLLLSASPAVAQTNQASVRVASGGTVLSAGSDSGEYDPSHVIVRFRTGAPVERLPGTAAARVLSAGLNLHVLDVPPGLSVAAAASRYRQNPNVLYAEPDYIVHADTTPNDTKWAQQWDMVTIGAPAAWNTHTDASDIVVAVVDTGVNFTHPDLAANIWNHPTDPTTHGYRCFAGVCNPGGEDDHGHGTHVAGTIGAVGNNNLGIAGINWNVRIAAFKFLNSGGSGSISDAVAAFEQIRSLIQNNGVNIRVINNSWGGGGYSQALKDAMAAVEALKTVNVCAAGNSGVNADVSPMWPGAYDNRGIISVLATDPIDNGAYFSNYGLASTDIAAPGVDTLSTVPTSSCALCDSTGYRTLSGTSMATPHVAGVVAAMMHINPNLTAEQARDVLLDPGSYDWMTNTRAQSSSSGGRLNFAKVLSSAKLTNPPALNNFPSVTMGSDISASAGSPVTISAGSSDPDGDSLRTSLGRMSANAWLFGWMNDTLFPVISSNPSTFSAPSLARTGVALYAGSVADNRGGGASAVQVVSVSPIGSPGSPPTGTLTASSNTAQVGGTITFTYAVTDPDGSGVPAWDFWSAGKGGASGSCCYTGSTAAMQFNTAGVYRISTQAVDRRLDLSAKATTVVRIGNPTPSGEPPIANATLDKLSGPAPLTVNINMSGSVDPDGSIAYYMYGCGGSFASAVTSPTGSCTFDSPGTYWILLQVLDNSNQMDLRSAYVVVTPDNGSGGGGGGDPDTTPPTVIMTSPNDGATVTGVVLVSADAGDDVGISKVDFYRDAGVLLGSDSSATGNSYSVNWDSTAFPGTHTLYAVATDTSGKTTTSATRTVTVPDTTSPTVTMASPANGATVSGMVTVSANASDNVAIDKVEFYLDGAMIGSDNSASGTLYSYDWDTGGMSPGTYTLQAKAIDTSSNSTMSATRSVTVPAPDTDGPTVSMVSPADGATVSGLVTVSADASDNVAIDRVEFYLDGALLGSDSSASGTNYSINWDTSGMSPGTTHTLNAIAFDTSGNTTPTPTRSVTIKPLNPPSVSIASPGATVARKSNVTLSATATAVLPKTVQRVDFFANGDFVCSDTTPSNGSTYSCPWKVPPPPNKTYSLTATVYDSDGVSKESNPVEVTSR